MPKFFDISPLVSSEIAVWPGDQSYQHTVSLDFSKGHNLMLSSVQTTVHLGAHTDGPNHYHPDGSGIDERPLHFYFGPAQVITVPTKMGKRILPEDLGQTQIVAPRILFKTKSFPDPSKFNEDFMSLSPELVDFLAERKVILAGIDTPSVDLFDDKELLSHNRIFHHDMAILEGIVLDDVEDGKYTLVALPLKLKGADASPVRAVLLQEP